MPKPNARITPADVNAATAAIKTLAATPNQQVLARMQTLAEGASANLAACQQTLASAPALTETKRRQLEQHLEASRQRRMQLEQQLGQTIDQLRKALEQEYRAQYLLDNTPEEGAYTLIALAQLATGTYGGGPANPHNVSHFLARDVAIQLLAHPPRRS